MTFPQRRLRFPAALILAAALFGARSAYADQVLDIAISPTLPSATDVLTVRFIVSVGCLELSFAPAQVNGDEIFIRGTYPSADDCPSSMNRTVTLPLGPLPAGDYRLRIEIFPEVEFLPAPFAVGDYALHVEPPSERLVLPLGLRTGQDNFDVAVTWKNQHADGAVGVGTPVRLSDRSGYFWFFDNQIPEVTIKILDGSTINEHFWLFLSSMTDVEVVVTVRKLMGSHCLDTGTCPTRVYTLAPGTVEGKVDLTAF